MIVSRGVLSDHREQLNPSLSPLRTQVKRVRDQKFRFLISSITTIVDNRLKW